MRILVPIGQRSTPFGKSLSNNNETRACFSKYLAYASYLGVVKGGLRCPGGLLVDVYLGWTHN